MPYIAKKKEFELVSVLAIGYGKTVPKVAKVLGCTPPTARKKMEHPELLTLGDLKKLCKGLHISADEIRAAIRF